MRSCSRTSLPMRYCEGFTHMAPLSHGHHTCELPERPLSFSWYHLLAPRVPGGKDKEHHRRSGSLSLICRPTDIATVLLVP